MKQRIYILMSAAVLVLFSAAGQTVFAEESVAEYITVEENTGNEQKNTFGGGTGDTSEDGGGLTDESENIGGGEGGNPMMAGGALKIDDANIYHGMERAYKDGYVPAVSGNTAEIVVPLKTDDTAEFDSVTVSLNLGGTENTPFVYKNYQKTFYKTVEKINGGNETSEVFLVSFSLELLQDRYNGTYPIDVQVSYGKGVSEMSQSFIVYVGIADGKDLEDENAAEAVVAETEEKPTSQPIIMISKSSVEPEKVSAGDDFEVKAVLKNTSKIKDIQNMSVTVTWSSEDIVLLEDSNMFYIDYIGREQTKEMVFKCRAGGKTADGRYEMKLDMSYDNTKAETLTSSGSIQVEITQPMKVELEVGEIPEEINAGDSLSVALQVMNLGRGSIYNARCNIEVPGLIADTSAFIGNMEGGSAAEGTLKLFAGTKQMNSELEGEQYGYTEGVIQLIYEDEDGKEYTEDYPVSTTIQALQMNMDKDTADDEEEVKTQWGLAVAAGLAVLVLSGGIPAIIYYRRKKMRGNKP